MSVWRSERCLAWFWFHSFVELRRWQAFSALFLPVCTPKSWRLWTRAGPRQGSKARTRGIAGRFLRSRQKLPGAALGYSKMSPRFRRSPIKFRSAVPRRKAMQPQTKCSASAVFSLRLQMRAGRTVWFVRLRKSKKNYKWAQWSRTSRFRSESRQIRKEPFWYCRLSSRRSPAGSRYCISPRTADSFHIRSLP